MKAVYTASNSIEAHLIKILLVGEGIEAMVNGDLLQGAIGELAAINAMQVLVNEPDVYMAKNIIRDWEQNRDDEDESWIPDELR